jgi:hypothetical protein
MKNISIILVALICFFLIGAFVESDQHNGAEFEVLAVHDIKIKADVNEKEFEAFVMNELAPIYNDMEGQNLTLVKGDRGVNTNNYAIILTFESIEDRDRIYPPSGELVGDFGDDSTWDKFNSMVEEGLGSHHTDYVKVVH